MSEATEMPLAVLPLRRDVGVAATGKLFFHSDRGQSKAVPERWLLEISGVAPLKATPLPVL